LTRSNENNDFPLLLSLLTDPAAFVVHVGEISHQHPTYKAAYEATEEMLEERTGYRHYASYGNFRQAKSRVQNRSKPKQMKLF